MKDLILLVADKSMHFALRGALSRPKALSIQEIEYEFLEHPGRDGGVRTTGAALLQLKRQAFDHALLVMDFEGSGATDAVMLEEYLDRELRQEWGNAAKAIVIEPELDIWMWGSDYALQQVIGGPKDTGIREWLGNQGFRFIEETNKPERPKEAMERLLRELRRPISAANYEKIARTISLQSCTDPAFLRLRETLQRWFPT
jgi:hypothetical protein